MSQKLKGIYDALEHGNYKNALKLCTALLQKQPGHALGKALQAVALERCGRRNEALRLCDAVGEECCRGDGGAAPGPGAVDKTVLSTLQVVYRRCSQPAAVAQLYDAASAREPESEELAVVFFLSSARARDFAKAQMVATKLFSKTKKHKFLHWVVVALLLQARAGAPARVLNLACMMLQKAPLSAKVVKDDAPFSREQFYLLLLHLTTLRLQGKYAEALELLDSHKALVKLPSDLSALRIQLLSEAGKLSAAAAEARASFEQRVGDWGAAQRYLRLAFQAPVASGSAPLPRRRCVARSASGEVALEIPEHGARVRLPSGEREATAPGPEAAAASEGDEVRSALMLFRGLQRRAGEGNGIGECQEESQLRVALLGELELRRLAFCAAERALLERVDTERIGESVRWSTAVAEGDLTAFVDLIARFIQRFRHRCHCYFDLKPFLCLLTAAEAAPILALPSDGEDRSAATTAARLRRGLSRPPALAVPADGADGDDTVAAEAQRLLAEWLDGQGPEQEQEASGDIAEGKAKVSKANEDLLLLAIVALIDLDRACCLREDRPGMRPHLFGALGLAEMGAVAFPHVFHFKVLLVLLYGAAGLPAMMLKSYRALEIKNVQNESLAHLAWDACCAFGCHDNIRETSMSILQFHENMEKDGGDAFFAAALSEVLHRVPEYLEAGEDVSSSVLWGWAVVEEILDEVGRAQTWEAVVDGLSRQSAVLSIVSERAIEDWTLKNQDRCLLNGLHPLPLCTPLDATAYSAQAWKGLAFGGRAQAKPLSSPTVLVQGVPSGAVGSSALLWPPLAPALAESSRGADEPAPPREKPRLSGAEELMLRGLARTPAQLKLAASLLLSLARLAAPGDSPRDREAAEALAPEAAEERLDVPLAQASAAAVLAELPPPSAAGEAGNQSGRPEGAVAASTEALEVTAARLLQEEAGARAAACWSQATARFAGLALRCAHLTMDAARTILVCTAGKGAWERAEAQLTSLAAAFTGFVERIRDKDGAAGDHGRPFAIGHHGVPWLWALLSGCLAVMLPALLWCTGALPKAGSGKRVKEGQETLHAARAALRGLLAAVHGGLNELYADLGAAQGAPIEDLLPTASAPNGAAECAEVRRVPTVPAFAASPRLAACREQARAAALEAHRAHLQKLQEAVGARLALLKARGGFKV